MQNAIVRIRSAHAGIQVRPAYSESHRNPMHLTRLSYVVNTMTGSLGLRLQWEQSLRPLLLHRGIMSYFFPNRFFLLLFFLLKEV